MTFLKLGKSKDATFDPLSLLAGLLPVYIDVLRRLAANGADWVQLDEPCLVLDLDDATREALRAAYGSIARALPTLKIMLTTYFGGSATISTLRCRCRSRACISIWFARRSNSRRCVAKAPQGLVLSLGVIDGRNIWRADLPALLDRLEPVVAKRGTDHVQIAPSCSLLHVPIDLDAGDRSRSGPEELARLRRARRWASLRRSARRSPPAAPSVTRRAGVIGRCRSSAQRSSPKVHDAAVAGADRSRHAGHGRAQARLCRARGVAAGALQPAGLPDDDDRLVPADRRRCARPAPPTPKAR